MRPPETGQLTPEQIDGIAREIGDMAIQGHTDKAWGWVRRLRGEQRSAAKARKYDPCATGGCQRFALPRRRYCHVFQDAGDVRVMP